MLCDFAGRSAGTARGFRSEPFLMPLSYLLFRPKPIVQIASMFAATLVPKFMSALGDLFFEAYIFVHVKNWQVIVLVRFCFHNG
jgi:hypothetical protein